MAQPGVPSPGGGSWLLAVPDKVVDGEADVAGDLPGQKWREIPARVGRDGGRAPIRMAEPLVGAALADFGKTERREDADDLARFEHRDCGHGRSHHDGLGADVVAFQLGLPVVEDQGDHFPQVGVELVERFALAVGARETRHVADVQPGVAAAFDDCGVRAHGCGFYRL